MSDVESEGAMSAIPGNQANLPGVAELAEGSRKEGSDILNLDPSGFEVIFDNNGWTREEFVAHRHETKTLELFLLNFPSVPHIQYFPNLVHVRMMHIGLTEMKHFEKLRQLQTLWLTENFIKKIACLDNCEQLRELNLQSNCISKIEGLSKLRNLEVLWLGNNDISKLEGLEQLVALRSLWLPTNKITTLTGCLDGNPKLAELNVAHNRISSFREIPPLNSLPCLDRLWLSDATFGTNPVCSLCNYQTFTVFHLRHIHSLDGLAVSNDQRGVAEATFLKKTMYYEMRIKTLRRNARNLLGKAAQLHGRKRDEVRAACALLERLQKELRRELDEDEAYAAYFAERAPATHTKAVREKLEQAQRVLADRRRDLAMFDARFASTAAQMAHTTESHIARLMVELNTGGNVRLEEGKAKEVWHQSCAELLRTRFFPSDFEPFGVKEIRVTKVTRLYNRSLRVRFDQALENLVDVTDASYKRALEYLFFADTSVSFHDAAINDAVEYGFRKEDFPTGVPLTNSVFVAEQGRLSRAQKAGELTGRGANPYVLVSRIVVAKVFLGKCASDKEKPASGTPTTTTTTATSAATGPAANVSPLLAGPPVNWSEHAPTTTSVYRAKPSDPRQRVWFCLDPELVLPEYIVEFAYVPNGAGATLPPTLEWGDGRTEEIGEVLTKLFPHASRVDLQDMRSHSPVFLSYVQWCNANSVAALRADATTALMAAPPTDLGQRPALPATALTPEEVVSEVVCTGPHRSAVPTLLTAHADWSTLRYANLLDRGLNSMDPLCAAPFAALTTLVLAFNNLTRILPALALTCPLLERLDLSHNGIRRIEHLEGMRRLECLDVGHNSICRAEDVREGLAILDALRELVLSGNPIVASAPAVLGGGNSGTGIVSVGGATGAAAAVGACAAIAALANVLPRLRMYNGETVTNGAIAPDAKSLGSSATTTALAALPPLIPAITPALVVWRLQQNGLPKPRATVGTVAGTSGGPPTEPRLEVPRDVLSVLPASASPKAAAAAAASEEGNASLLAAATALTLPGLQICRVDSLTRMTNLAVLDLSDNLITRIEGLGRCTQLTHLNLENNAIASMDGLQGLRELRRLELGGNRIARIEGLGNCPRLAFLSLEDNLLESIAPLAAATALAEAYLCNNVVANGKEVNCLRELPKLIILDLSGNPCCGEELYRTYTVFQMKKLKVLDGVSIDVAETTLAKDTFAGRVSAELLGERVAPNTPWPMAVELSLSSCALREVALLESFTSLQHLKLDHNALVDVSGLRCCTALVSLNLSFNKIGAGMVGRALENMTRLESMSLEANGIPSLAGLQLRLPRLKFVNLKSNEIQRIDGLDAVPQLREILLDKNRLRAVDRDSFLHTPLLRELYLEENAIKTFDGVRALPGLQKLSLASNRVTELGDLERGLDGLVAMVEICLLGNSVVRKSMYRPHLIHLLPSVSIIDNRDVTPEERERAAALFQQDAQIPPNVFTDVRTTALGIGQLTVAMPQPPVQARSALRVMTIDGMVADAPLLGHASSNALLGNNRGRAPAQPAPAKVRTGSADLTAALRPRPKPTVASVRGRIGQPR